MPVKIVKSYDVKQVTEDYNKFYGALKEGLKPLGRAEGLETLSGIPMKVSQTN